MVGECHSWSVKVSNKVRNRHHTYQLAGLHVHLSSVPLLVDLISCIL